MGITPDAVATRGEDLLERLGLRTRLPPLPHPELWQVMARDKKADRGVRFVLLEDIGAPVLATPERATVDAVIDELTIEGS